MMAQTLKKGEAAEAVLRVFGFGRIRRAFPTALKGKILDAACFDLLRKRKSYIFQGFSLYNFSGT